MKKLLLPLLLVAATAFAADEVITRGAAISKDAKTVAIADVLANPESFKDATIVTDGVVVANCENKGCWMQLAPEPGKPGMRVTFKDYGFFVPLDSKGMKARIQGTVSVQTMTKDMADHLEEEGAKFTRNPDGTAKEIAFVATGVELTK